MPDPLDPRDPGDPRRPYDPGVPIGPADPDDQRIRALLARAVAQAPAAPTAAEVDRAGRAFVGAAVPAGEPAGRGRPLLAVAASIAVVVLVVAGALLVGRLGGPSSDTAMPGDGLAVRFVPGDVPPGLELAAIVSSPPEPPAPLPRVSVFEGDDGVTVRIASGSLGWAAGAPGAPTTTTTGPAATMPPTTAPDTTSPPASGGTTPESTTLPTTSTSPSPSTSTTGSTTSSTDPPTTSTTAAGSPGTTLGPTGSTTPGDSPATTVAPSVDLPQLPGLPTRPGLRTLAVRGMIGALEVHDDTTSTIWFEHQAQLVAVDVIGLDQDYAIALVERLQARSDGGFAPDPADGLVSRTEIGSSGPATDPPEVAQLVYAPDPAVGGPAFVVTTSPLRPGRGDLLTATAGWFGRIERWGDRQVLVDDGADGAATAVSFVDPAGVLVTVQGTGGLDDLRRYVDALEPIDQQAWDELAAEHPDLTVPATIAAPTTAPATASTTVPITTTRPATTG